MSEIIPLKNNELPSSCFVFKHSTKCPVSFSAATEVKAAYFEKPLFWVNVVEQRDISSWIAEHYQTKHESPQLLEIEAGKVTGVWNHGAIYDYLHGESE